VAQNQGFPQLIDRFWGKGIAYLRSVEGNTGHTLASLEGYFFVFFFSFPEKFSHDDGVCSQQR
jgi:hypothetical protein